MYELCIIDKYTYLKNVIVALINQSIYLSKYLSISIFVLVGCLRLSDKNVIFQSKSTAPPDLYYVRIVVKIVVRQTLVAKIVVHQTLVVQIVVHQT